MATMSPSVSFLAEPVWSPQAARQRRAQLPHVVLRLCQTVGDGFGGVDDAAAAHRQQKIDPLRPAEADALIGLAKVRIGHDAAELAHRQPFPRQRRADGIQQP